MPRTAIITPSAPVEQSFHAGGSQAGAQQAVSSRGSAAALQVAQDGQTRFLAGQFFELLRQPQGVVGVMGVEGNQLFGGLLAVGLLVRVLELHQPVYFLRVLS